jgi:hypothetical protein
MNLPRQRQASHRQAGRRRGVESVIGKRPAAARPLHTAGRTHLNKWEGTKWQGTQQSPLPSRHPAPTREGFREAGRLCREGGPGAARGDAVRGEGKHVVAVGVQRSGGHLRKGDSGGEGGKGNWVGAHSQRQAIGRGVVGSWGRNDCVSPSVRVSSTSGLHTALHALHTWGGAGFGAVRCTVCVCVNACA